MSDYQQTRTVSGEIVSRFASMLQNLEDDYEEEIAVAVLMKHYKLAKKYSGDDEDLLWAIEKVISEFMHTEEFNKWLKTRDVEEST